MRKLDLAPLLSKCQWNPRLRGRRSWFSLDCVLRSISWESNRGRQRKAHVPRTGWADLGMPVRLELGRGTSPRLNQRSPASPDWDSAFSWGKWDDSIMCLTEFLQNLGKKCIMCSYWSLISWIQVLHCRPAAHSHVCALDMALLIMSVPSMQAQEKLHA